MKKKFLVVSICISLIFFSIPFLTSCNEAKYTLIYHTNSDEIEESITLKQSNLDSFTLPELTKDGHTFEGWFFDNGYKNEYTIDKLKVGNNELYAKWTLNEYKITVHNESETNEYIFKYNEIIKLNIMEKNDYIFDGYYINEELTNKFEVITMPSNDIDLYPKFVKKMHYYTLVFHTNTDQYFDCITKDYSELSEIVLPIPEKEKYVFDGWFLDSEYKEEYSLENLEEGINELYAKYILAPYSYTVKIISNINNALSLTGGSLEQTITNDNSFEPVEIEPKYGYKFLYYEIDGRKYNESTIKLSNITKDIEVKVFSEYATYELPIVNIDTNNTPIVNKIDYVDMNFSIENCDDELLNVSGGIRFRGNSTLGYAKKPYRIKFDKKQSLFGLTKAKSWVLLADYLDPSCLHNYVALSLGNELDGLSFTPTPHKVNVYMNGEYIGLYTLCEQVQENEGRINIEKKITEDMIHLKDFNFFISMDRSVIDDIDAILDETYFYIEKYDKYFELKYPEKADFVSEEQFNLFFNELKQYILELMDAFSNNDYLIISQEVNINSLADYLIVDNIMMEHDHFWKSFNLYYTSTALNADENNKINFGPIWDYDWALDTPWTGSPNVYYEVSNDLVFSNTFFESFCYIPELSQILKERYTNNMSDILSSFIDDLFIFEDSIKESLVLNANKWYETDYKITLNNIILLNKFLLNRKVVLDKEWRL